MQLSAGGAEGGGDPRVASAETHGAGDNGTVTVIQPTLDLWDEPAPDHRDRIVARSADRLAWLKARSRGVTATDVARLSGPASVRAVANDKLFGYGFGGNAYTDHGRAREPEIARWVERHHGIVSSDALFHAAGETGFGRAPAASN